MIAHMPTMNCSEYVAHLGPFSVPTRRSSDLRSNSFSYTIRRPSGEIAGNWTPSSLWRVTCCGAPPRSEEHTSELQSPCNLVCPHLLEKKKDEDAFVELFEHNTMKYEEHELLA